MKEKAAEEEKVKLEAKKEEKAFRQKKRKSTGDDDGAAENRKMTFDERSLLGAFLHDLDNSKLAEVVDITGNIEFDLADLDNETLWKLAKFVKMPKKKPPPAGADYHQRLQQEMADTKQEVMQVEAALHSLDQGSQGIAPSQDDDDNDDDEVPDSGDDDDAGLPPPVSNAGGGSSAMWADFQNSKKQREREQQQEAQLEGERARAHEHERQRAAERAQREGEAPVADLLEQANVMNDFISGADGLKSAARHEEATALDKKLQEISYLGKLADRICELPAPLRAQLVDEEIPEACRLTSPEAFVHDSFDLTKCSLNDIKWIDARVVELRSKPPTYITPEKLPLSRRSTFSPLKRHAFDEPDTAVRPTKAPQLQRSQTI